MEPVLRRIPENMPQDLIKLRIENSHLTELPRGSFFNVSALEFLWLNFDNITVMDMKSLEGLSNLTELRLEGNKLSSVPWTAFQDTPNLKVLDLKHNQLDVLPENALRYLPRLTYLDLSFNKLNVISRDVFLSSALHHRSEKQGKCEEITASVVLALNDNPWLCDCRLKGFVDFIRSVNLPVILTNLYLTCTGPGFRVGKYFHEVELKSCMKPVATAPVTNLTRPLGFNATLTCLIKGSPDPVVQWTYGLKKIRGFTEIQTQMAEDTIKSELVIPSLHLAARGVYTCTAINIIGNSSTSITVNIKSLNTSSALLPMNSLASAEENASIDIRVAKQTVYGITLEWYAVTENPEETWYTIYFRRIDDAKKEMIYIGPGINSYSVNDLLPATKYEICVSLKNQAPRSSQCVIFMSGSDISELEQREKLIHIIVIVCAMVLAIPAGMYACNTESCLRCLDRCTEECRRNRHGEKNLKPGGRQDTFDSLQEGSNEGSCRDLNEDKGMRRFDEKSLKVKGDQRTTAELY
ncbi:leucine-rich repeat, immunoglobulin-like domain and transmembrane domain-containing protein 2 [Brienomyrus brachyistius]|uniref:leucine-rich repeat, immunoglobulin-like domain and transmembrane domain-containing protein 2 n=1 Tax=Brienomyrus brachyistius TaxID=42636 RepID=UPI0020B1CD73|nr:leucine-rich repeat, immunoglobulin-like domain and transmembrane domain-containing protein 2 [Brienomyrus brachyistius]